jgi:hypothetical protein
VYSKAGWKKHAGVAPTVKQAGLQVMRYPWQFGNLLWVNPGTAGGKSGRIKRRLCTSGLTSPVFYQPAVFEVRVADSKGQYQALRVSWNTSFTKDLGHPQVNQQMCLHRHS